MRKLILSLLICSVLLTPLIFSTLAVGEMPRGLLDREANLASKPVVQVTEISPPQSLKAVANDQVETVKKLVDIIIEFFVKYSFQVLGGFIVLMLGWFIGGFIAKKLLVFFENKEFDITVSKFIASCVKLLVLVFAVIVALGKFGIEIAPLIAGISVAGFGISFALQGPLANYAAGISLIFAKPFAVGDIIEVAGRTGEVLEIKLPRTEMRTVDGVLVMIPNSQIVGEIIHNCSNFKRVDIDVGVSYKSDVQKAITIINDVITNDGRISKKANPTIGIKAFGDSSIDLHARVWCKQTEYWNVLFELNKKIFDEFGSNGIEIPFPQRDVHVYKDQL